MTSAARIAANRLNAKKSTGPKTVEGRKRSSQNARKHGLSSTRRPLDWAFIGRLVDKLANGYCDEARMAAEVYAIAAADVMRLHEVAAQLSGPQLLETIAATPVPPRDAVRQLSGATREAKKLRAGCAGRLAGDLVCILADASEAQLEILSASLEKGTASFVTLETMRALDRAESRAQSRLRRAALALDRAMLRDDVAFDARLFRPGTNPS